MCDNMLLICTPPSHWFFSVIVPIDIVDHVSVLSLITNCSIDINFLSHTFIDQGKVYGWGNNEYGQLGDAVRTTQVTLCYGTSNV